MLRFKIEEPKDQMVPMGQLEIGEIGVTEDGLLYICTLGGSKVCINRIGESFTDPGRTHRIPQVRILPVGTKIVLEIVDPAEDD